MLASVKTNGIAVIPQVGLIADKAARCLPLCRRYDLEYLNLNHTLSDEDSDSKKI